MARDTLAVPCTGAGVERQFSKSRRATPWTRARLSPETIGQIMMYKDYLRRKDQPNLEWHGTVEDMEELSLQKGGKCSAEIMGGLVVESSLGFSLSSS